MARETIVRLMNVPLKSDYKHTFYFKNAEEQQAYFLGLEALTETELSYQRKDEVMRFPKHIDELRNYNYLMYKNAETSNKWYYCFIREMKFNNENRTDLYLETDVMQTYLEEITILPSFVEREHVYKDAVGEHTIEENVQLGDYIVNKHTKAGYSEGDLVIVVATTESPEGNKFEGTLYNNIYSGLRYYTFAHTLEGIEELKEWIDSFDSDGAGEAIECMFLAPLKLTFLRTDHTIAGTNFVDTFYINHNVTSPDMGKEIAITEYCLNGYAPRNRKLLCYPYRYLMVTNNNGVAVPMKYEEFSNDELDPKFIIEGCLTPGCSVRLIPEHYKGVERNDEEGINLGKFPALNWTSDVFTNWLTQNAVNIGVSIASDIVQIGVGVATGIATGGVGGAIGGGTALGGLQGIANTVGEIYKAAKTPPQSKGNTNAGDVITASGQNDFHFYDMSIKKEYASIIDGYLDMFGYKVNTVKIPEKNHREQWWFTKTIDVFITGTIPNNDLEKIKGCYNNGITFWKYPQNIGKYNLSNRCMSEII